MISDTQTSDTQWLETIKVMTEVDKFAAYKTMKEVLRQGFKESEQNI